MHKLAAATLLMASLAGCKTIEVGKDPPPAERLICEGMPEAPNVTPLEAYRLPDGTQFYYKKDVDERDANIAPFIVNLRGAWFSCSNQLAWNRDYWSE